MKFKKLADAAKQNLTRLTHWFINTADDRKYLESSHEQVMKNPLRKTMFVQGEDHRIALFVDRITNSGDTGRPPKSGVRSQNGKYTSIYHFAEVLFSKNPELTIEQWKKEMEKQYPKSESAGIRCYSHYCLYRHHLVMQGRFKYIPVPSWFKGKAS